MSEPSEPTALEALMIEVAANMVAISEAEMANVLKPPRGRMSEVGPYHDIDGNKLKRKQLDALQALLDETAYKTAAMIFALIDGAVDGQAIPLPELELRVKGGAPLEGSLLAAFHALWDEEESA
ncbi:MAG: hypothetical protein KDD73_07250 [Anaerolineales bacterium]|nr:hypothetical protein [Anaerolineales bacterium]MCB9127042.1 hypothetical protein [Ardenticatenales bacterium]MCB9172434.1 hypothetical protein [Ardenticatenales bacterium]